MATWEIRIQRHSVQRRGSRARTVGTYQVFHDGQPVADFEGTPLAGTTAESRGPGANSPAENGRRVEARRYPLATQDGTKYDTYGYRESENPHLRPKPGIELRQTGARREILIHPGIGFLASIGCINLCTRLPDAAENISYPGSRRRVIALIQDMKRFLGNEFPDRNGRAIPNAFAVIEGEP
ncbi:MAG TPA: hypothetical protein VEA61_06005 [Allosphingosinicella sp.]|nr:hypothetical protein [Allosphingosinicella sp.]